MGEGLLMLLGLTLKDAMTSTLISVGVGAGAGGGADTVGGATDFFPQPMTMIISNRLTINQKVVFLHIGVSLNDAVYRFIPHSETRKVHIYTHHA